jgi:hypothetical protein
MVTLTGKAAAHTSAASIKNLTITFLDAAFKDIKAASVENSTKNDIFVTFHNVGTPTRYPSALSFTDTDLTEGKIGGVLNWTPPSNLTGIDGYRVYWGSGTSAKLAGYEEQPFEITGASSDTWTLPANTALPAGARYFLIYSYNEAGNSSSCSSAQLKDRFLPAFIPTARNDFTDTDLNQGKIGGEITWTAVSYTNSSNITGYHIYWGADENTKLAGYGEPLYTRSSYSNSSQMVPADTPLPAGAAYFLIYTYNDAGDSLSCLAVPILDFPVYVTLSGVSANGNISGEPTTLLTLTFDTAIRGLAADDITITTANNGARKGAAVNMVSQGVYTLALGAVVQDTITSISLAKTGYIFSYTAGFPVSLYPCNLVLGDYTGDTASLSFTDGTVEEALKIANGCFQYTENPGKIIHSFTLGTVKQLIGRKAAGRIILRLNAAGTELSLRDQVTYNSPTLGNSLTAYPIGSYAEFQLIGKTANLAYNYMQELDLDLLGADSYPGGKQTWASVGKDYSEFTGLFDGNGKTLANLYGGSSNSRNSLFGVTGTAAKLANINVTSASGNTSICLRNSGTITGCHLTAVGSTGGICGGNAASGLIERCTVDGTINGLTGGISGTNAGTIKGCRNNASVTGTPNQAVTPYVGGIVSDNYGSGTITGCVNTGSISNGKETGGIVGYNRENACIIACYNTGTISSEGDAGGICGQASTTNTIIACYNRGALSTSATMSPRKGNILGYAIGTIAVVSCYYGDSSNGSAQTGEQAFNAAWGSPPHAAWGTGDAAADGTENKYWKSLYGGGSNYPKLWWEN